MTPPSRHHSPSTSRGPRQPGPASFSSLSPLGLHALRLSASFSPCSSSPSSAQGRVWAPGSEAPCSVSPDVSSSRGALRPRVGRDAPSLRLQLHVFCPPVSRGHSRQPIDSGLSEHASGYLCDASSCRLPKACFPRLPAVQVGKRLFPTPRPESLGHHRVPSCVLSSSPAPEPPAVSRLRTHPDSQGSPPASPSGLHCVFPIEPPRGPFDHRLQ